jgi:carboxypeptidase family protein
VNLLIRSKRVVSVCLFLAFFLAITPVLLYAQTATSGVVTGTVTDASKASVPGAKIILALKGTGFVLNATTDSAGSYTFASVPPGEYTLKISAKGFRTAEVSKLNVEIAKQSTLNMTLEVGAATEVVEVVASTGAELQTTDATIGEVMSGEALQRFPVNGRSASSLLLLQPGVEPDVPSGLNSSLGGDIGGGQISGARSEQITFTIDGGDATSDLEGSNSYISPDHESPAVSSVVPIPIEDTAEFRVATSNPNSTFGRSSGGQVSLLTKEGTNTIHGSAYEYHQDSGLNSNSWDNNFSQIHKPHSVDNRFGGQVGGPIIKDKLFYSGFFEARRFYDNSTETRVIPTDTLKKGILTFGGVQYNFNPANGPLTTACGGPCDPRGIGVSPVVMAQLALYPEGNNATVGDGSNTTGFTFNVATPVIQYVAKGKINYNLNSKWSLFATYQYSKITRTGDDQVNILTRAAASGDPYYASFYTFQAQGQLTPNLISVTHGSYLRNWWAWLRTTPTPLVSGTNSALQISGEGVGLDSESASLSKLFADPININTQQARSRIWDGHDWYIAQDMTWIHGKHTIQFGGAGYIWDDYHLRTDDVLGGLTSAPINYIGSLDNSSNSFVSVGSAFEPTALNPNDASRWNGLYASILGLVDHSAQIETRDGRFQPNSLGTPLFDRVRIPSFTTYVQDVWKVRPSLTITFGMNYGVQLPPSEASGKEVVMAYADSNTPVNYQEFLQNRVAALSQGVPFNPTFTLIPVNSLSGNLRGKMRFEDWTDVGPRVAVAWQVPFNNKFFGDHKTVIRGGYGKVFDRTSAVNQVLSPLLTGGLADVDECAAPQAPSVAGSISCGVASGTDPTNAFRIGHDGNTIPIPAPTAQTIPFTPAAPFGLILSAPLDPFATPGYSHSIDLTIQRALPHNMFVEVGYIGRFSRNLPQGQALNAPYYLMRATKGGQTLAQAFDAVALQLRAGVKPGAVTAQPFFETLLGGTAFCLNPKNFGSTCTAAVASADSTDWIRGDLNSVTEFALNFLTPSFIDNMQILEFAGNTDRGFSNYNAGFVSFRKNMSHGLQFQADWTWSHAIGNGGTNQQYLVSSNSPYNINLDRASETFDHRHIFHISSYYELPFGKGRTFALGNNVANRIIGGWHMSGIWTYYTGGPFCAGADGNYGSFFNVDCGIPSGSLPSLSLHSGVAGSASGLSAFANPGAVFSSLSRPLLSVDGRVPFDQFSAFPYWNLDFSVGKNLAVTERFRMVLTADAFNLFNHVIFKTPSLDLSNASQFGVISSQANTILDKGAYGRALQLGLRFEF